MQYPKPHHRTLEQANAFMAIIAGAWICAPGTALGTAEYDKLLRFLSEPSYGLLLILSGIFANLAIYWNGNVHRSPWMRACAASLISALWYLAAYSACLSGAPSPTAVMFGGLWLIGAAGAWGAAREQSTRDNQEASNAV